MIVFDGRLVGFCILESSKTRVEGDHRGKWRLHFSEVLDPIWKVDPPHGLCVYGLDLSLLGRSTVSVDVQEEHELVVFDKPWANERYVKSDEKMDCTWRVTISPRIGGWIIDRAILLLWRSPCCCDLYGFQYLPGRCRLVICRVPRRCLLYPWFIEWTTSAFLAHYVVTNPCYQKEGGYIVKCIYFVGATSSICFFLCLCALQARRGVRGEEWWGEVSLACPLESCTVPRRSHTFCVL